MKPGAARVSLPVRKDPTRSPSCRRIGYYSRTYCPTSAKTRLLLLAVLSLVFLSHVQIDETVAEVGADAFVGGRHRCRHDAELNLHSLQDRLDCLQENALRERRRRTGRNFAARGGGGGEICKREIAEMTAPYCREDSPNIARRQMFGIGSERRVEFLHQFVVRFGHQSGDGSRLGRGRGGLGYNSLMKHFPFSDLKYVKGTTALCPLDVNGETEGVLNL